MFHCRQTVFFDTLWHDHLDLRAFLRCDTIQSTCPEVGSLSHLSDDLPAEQKTNVGSVGSEHSPAFGFIIVPVLQQQQHLEIAISYRMVEDDRSFLFISTFSSTRQL